MWSIHPRPDGKGVCCCSTLVWDRQSLVCVYSTCHVLFSLSSLVGFMTGGADKAVTFWDFVVRTVHYSSLCCWIAVVDSQ